MLVSIIVFVIGMIAYTHWPKEDSTENIERITFTETVGNETYIIDIGADGYFEGVGMSEEKKMILWSLSLLTIFLHQREISKIILLNCAKD